MPAPNITAAPDTTVPSRSTAAPSTTHPSTVAPGTAASGPSATGPSATGTAPPVTALDGTPVPSTAACTAASGNGAPHAALEGLAAALGSRDFATVLTTGQGRRPRLTVTSRYGPATEDVYADGFYWWGHAERICPVADPHTAARKIAAVLHADPGEQAAADHAAADHADADHADGDHADGDHADA